MKKADYSAYAILVLRIGISSVLLWFGINEASDPGAWVGYVPQWLSALHPFSTETFILINGITEIIIGLGILVGFYLRLFALLAAIHMLSVVIAVGYNEIGVRDFGLLVSSIALFLSDDTGYSLDAYRKKRK